MSKEEIFKYEEKRLEEVIQKINTQIKNNEQKFSEQEHFIIGFKEGLRGTQFNRQAMMSFYATEIAKLKSIINNPYFGRFDFTDNEGKKQTIYIGKKSIVDENNKAIAYDWRSNICSMYYDYNIGPAEYEVNGTTEKGEITSKRQIIIKNGKLDSVSEQDTVSDDQILLKYLNESADARLKSIIATIQREQNKIIRSPLKNDYIIAGVAGSGKTTVALHRIAYLLYNEARNINETEFMILGPNKYFLNYISELLPELDIRNVSSATYEEIAMNNLKLKAKLESKNITLENILNGTYDPQIISYKSSIEYLKLIEKFVESYIVSHIQSDITYEGITLCKKERIINLVLSNLSKNNNSYADKIGNMIKNLTKEIKDNSDDINHEIWQQYRDEFLSLPKDSPRRKEIIDITENIKKEVKKGCPNAIKEYFKFIKVNPLHLYTAFLENIDSIVKEETIHVLQMTSLQRMKKKYIEYSDIAPLLYISYLISGASEYASYEHLVIDEAQDLSLADYYVLKQIFPEATFDIYGDINQSIYGYTGINDWQMLNHVIFDDKANILNLNKSYRTTREIADTSNLVLNTLHRNHSECVARNGNPISINNLDYTDELLEITLELKELLDKKYETIAIICKDDKETNEAYKNLSKLGLNINLITDKNEEYHGGVSILPSYLSKGLEFDAVILYNANEDNYKDDIISQKLLYVAITRAMHELCINYTGNISHSLENLVKEDTNTKKLIKEYK